MDNRVTPLGTTGSHPQQERLAGLELFRFLSAFSILVWHYQQFLFVGASAVGLTAEAQPFYSVLFPFYQIGHLGVQVFWCISGFVFFYKYRDALQSGLVTGRQFFWLRFSRLYPLHIATLLIVASLQLYRSEHALQPFVYIQNTPFNFIGHLFMANGWFGFERFSFNGPVWSVSTEVLIYAAFFFAACSQRLTLTSTLATIAVCFGILLIGSRHASVSCLMLFFMGGASELIFRQYRNTPFFWYGILGAALVAAFGFIAVVSGFVKFKPVVYLVLGLSSACLLAVLRYLEKPFNALGNLPATLGSLTYSSYLIHFPLKLAIVTMAAQNGWTIPFYDARFFVGWMAFVLSLSWLVFRFFEAPAQDKIRSYVTSRGQMAGAVTSASQSST